MASRSTRDRSRTFAWFAALLWRVDVRVVLSTAIIVSLLPFEWVARLDPVFLILFGLEFVIRATVLFRGEAGTIGDTHRPIDDQPPGWRWPKPSALLLLLFDLLALISFVPFSVDASSGRWLRLFRLTRMLLLLSYWGPLARDVWGVMARRERAKQVALMGIVVLVLSFSGAVVIEHVTTHQGRAVDFDEDGQVGDQDANFFVHLWWAFRQIQDPGNMLSSPGEAVVVVVSLALTVVGLFMVSFLIGLGTDVVGELMELSRLRPPGLRGHTIVVNIDPSTQHLLHMLIRYSKKLVPGGQFSVGWVRQLLRNTRRRGLGGWRYVVAGNSHHPPDFLRQPDLVDIVYRRAQVDEASFLARTDTLAAQRIVLLADFTATDPDAETIQALLTITQSLAESAATERGAAGRKRLLIAEILDESNVPAAKLAITAGHGDATRAFVIPTERLIALFIACITRRPGCERLLEGLLTSSGHELYTCFFDDKGLGYCESRRPRLPTDPHHIMAALKSAAHAMSGTDRVVPLGFFMDAEPADGVTDGIADEPRVVINAECELALDPSTHDADIPTPGPTGCRGFFAIAASFSRVRALSEALFDAKSEVRPAPTAPGGLPEFEWAPTTPLRRVLICGFRSATVGMVESLVKAEPRAQILIMVADARMRDRALDDFDAHTRLIERGLLRGHHGRFRKAKDQALLTWLDPGRQEAAAGPHVYLAIGDWASSRQLTSLPLGFGTVAKLDAVILVSDEKPGSDARTAKTLMKLETLVDRDRAPRVVAEVLDVELARRLRRRSTQLGDSRVLVYSIQELRAFFMFQAVVVPAFDLVYAELMTPWGQSFVNLAVVTPGEGLVGFEQLGDHIGERRVLVGVELRSVEGGTRLFVGEGDPDDHGRIDLGRLVSVWVIADDGRPG